MKLHLVALASLAAVVTATNYNDVLSDISGISKATNTLTADTKKVKSGIAGVKSALQVQVDAVNIR